MPYAEPKLLLEHAVRMWDSETENSARYDRRKTLIASLAAALIGAVGFRLSQGAGTATNSKALAPDEWTVLWFALLGFVIAAMSLFNTLWIRLATILVSILGAISVFVWIHYQKSPALSALAGLGLGAVLAAATLAILSMVWVLNSSYRGVLRRWASYGASHASSVRLNLSSVELKAAAALFAPEEQIVFLRTYKAALDLQLRNAEIREALRTAQRFLRLSLGIGLIGASLISCVGLFQ